MGNGPYVSVLPTTIRIIVGIGAPVPYRDMMPARIVPRGSHPSLPLGNCWSKPRIIIRKPPIKRQSKKDILMRANICKVIQAFKLGKSAIGDSKRTCWTDGSTIFSYQMPIAWWESDLKDPTILRARVVDYEDGPSRTTKSQIRACQYELAMMYYQGQWIKSPYVCIYRKV